MPDVLAQDDVLSFDPSSPMVTTPPSAPSPVASRGAVDMQPRIDEARRRSDAAIGRLEQSGEQEEANAAARAKALEPLRQRQLALAEKNLTQLEQPPPKAQQPPATPQRQNQHDDEQWLFSASLLGALAGGLTRRHLTNGLAAFSGAMEGYHEGSRQKFDQNMKIWEAENKKVIETNKAAMDEYRTIMENTKLSQDQMSIALQIAASKYDDQAMALSAKSKNSLQIAQHYDKEAEALERFERSHNALSQSRAAATAREQEQQAIQFVANNQPIIDAIIRGDRAPPPANPRTGLQGAIDRAMTAAIYTQAPDFKAGQWEINQAAKKSEARARAQIDPRVEQRTLGAFTAGPEGRSVRSINVAEDHLEALGELVGAIENKDINIINRIKNYIESEFGVSAPTNLNAAKQIISAEVIKAVVASGGGVTERQEASKYISGARSPEQLIGIIAVYQRLMAGQAVGLKKQYESGTNRTDFDERFLAPETKKQLDLLHKQGVPNPPNEMKSLVQRIANQAQSAGMSGARDVGRDIESGLTNRNLRDDLSRSGYPQNSGDIAKEMVPGALQTPEAIKRMIYDPPKPASPDMPVMLPQGWTMKELQ